MKSGERVCGLTVLESNLLGRAKSLIAVAKSQDGEPAGTLVYIDPHVLGTDFQFFAFATRDDTREDAWDRDEEVGSCSCPPPTGSRTREFSPGSRSA
ncbi:MAG: hypothetical protein HZB55_07605 [Deltaproteobacteria bacterium]|nr:hypothetical protein [Deltaproteobacteria bacterium]